MNKLMYIKLKMPHCRRPRDDSLGRRTVFGNIKLQDGVWGPVRNVWNVLMAMARVETTETFI